MYTTTQMQVLMVKPGITDLASIQFINENELLAKAEHPEEYYINEIMPAKLQINMEYVNNRGFFKDLLLIFKTLSKIAGK
jgi:lipopolysaccharide/colanic/teichoic acid biosynthesis glycosyltransferase